jgi:glucans biosynthesis protein
MIPGLTRRALLAAAMQMPFPALPAGAAAKVSAAAGALPRLGPPQPFDFETVKRMARERAASPYVDHPPRYGDRLEAIDFDAARQIAYRAAATLWPPADGPFPVRLFHLHRYAKDPVRIFRVSRGLAREVLYDDALFAYGDSPALRGLPTDLGFAGFRVLEPGGRGGDWLEFQSASYFRSAGELRQYGASARGVTVDTVGPQREEFPLFTPFWIEEPSPRSNEIIVTALLDGFSLAGAFRFVVRRERAIVMDVEAALYPRKDIAVLGIAPLTSMLWLSPSARRGALSDWRPQVHDSDGLAILTGAGESLWRPLNNPASVRTTSFADRDPKGFGLLQRDRSFADYQDDGAFYDRRPSVWIEPRGAWGEGAVQLVEIPTGDEVHDNIVAYWWPRQPVRAGSEHVFAYRMTWCAAPPRLPPLARVVATRIGLGGMPGQPRPADQRKLVVDFAGGPLAGLRRTDAVQPILTASGGRIVRMTCYPVVAAGAWRVMIDIAVAGEDAIDLRLTLVRDGAAISESWCYAYLAAADPIVPTPPSP